MVRATVFEIAQIGPENPYGTAVAATKRLSGTSIEPAIQSVSKAHRTKGSRWVNTATQHKSWTKAKVSSDAAQYTDLSYLLAMMLGAPDIQAAGVSSKNHTFTPPTWSAIVPKAFTVEAGSAARAMKFPYGIIPELGMEFSRDAVKLKGEMLGQKLSDGITLTAGTNEVQTQSKVSTVSGGTFTITFKGETTTAIAYNASNATVLAALEALPNIDPGDVTLASGPVNSGGMTITFGGQYASLNVPLMTIDSTLLTGGGSYTIAETTPGVPLSELGLQPIAGDEWDFYLDSTSGGLGGTKWTSVFKCSWKISDLFGPVWVGNTSNTSWKEHVDLAPKTEVKFLVAADSTGMGLVSQLESGDKRFVRIKCTGPTIDAYTYLAQFDFAVEVMKIGEFKDEDGVYAVEYTCEIAHDATYTKALEFLIRNTITAIA